LRATCIFGGVSIDPQIAALRAGCEIVVATPGRLLDHVQQKTIALNQVEFLVLDEADRMLDMGFMPDIRRILALLPAQRQSLLFSATFPDEVKRLSEQLLKNPIRIEVARPNATADTVTHTIHRCEEAQKRRLLTHLVRSRELRQVLVFTRTRLSARRLARYLQEEGLSAAEIHSDKTQAERMQALADFKANAITLLVATDIAARGLDITQLPHVINFELPQSAEDYVHRIGRTGRAGQSGEAISLVSPEEDEMLASIERLIKRKLPLAEVPGWQPSARGERDRDGAPRRARGDSTRTDSARGDRRREDPRPRPAEPAARRPVPAQDPLFTSAYVPREAAETAAGERTSPPPAARPARRHPVPALLARLPDTAG
jgi:ATP-dependent RNA helicase RhlE